MSGQAETRDLEILLLESKRIPGEKWQMLDMTGTRDKPGAGRRAGGKVSGTQIGEDPLSQGKKFCLDG